MDLRGAPSAFQPGQKKGPGDGGQPDPNNRVSRGDPQGERGPANNVCRVAPFLFSQYIFPMLWRTRKSRGRIVHA